MRRRVSYIQVRVSLAFCQNCNHCIINSGEDDSGREFVKLGGDGVISVTANVAPKLMHEMLKLSRMGNEVEAKAIDDILMPLHKRYTF